VALLVALAGLLWWAFPALRERWRGPAPVEEARPAPAVPSPSSGVGDEVPGGRAEPAPEARAPAEVPAVPVPELGKSDAFVRERVGALSSHPALAGWLRRSGLVDLFVVSVDNVADGTSPRRHLGFLRPRGGYLVLGAGPELRTDPATYLRYRAITEVVESLDAAACARLYRLLLPLFQESYERLGYPGARFHDRFAEALVELLRAPLPPREPVLEERVGRYVYADPRLEGASDAQKQLLRLGPRGVRAVQKTLRDVAAELAIEVGPAPRASRPAARP
jgi:Protein of unknown function (DUF3014)